MLISTQNIDTARQAQTKCKLIPRLPHIACLNLTTQNVKDTYSLASKETPMPAITKQM